MQRLHIITSPRIQPATPEKMEDESTISVEAKKSDISDTLNENSLPPPVYNELVVEDEKKGTTTNGGVENVAFSADE